MLTNVKAVLFDLDGTLIDSMWMWKDIDIAYLARYGYELPSDLQQTIEGMSFYETAVYFKEHFHLRESIPKIQQEWIQMAQQKYRCEVTMKPGAIRFLQYLRVKGIRTGIATSNGRELLETALEALHLEGYIDYAMTSCEAGAGKPAPDIYLKVAEVLGAKPEECLVFEDTPTGMQAGLNARIPVCAMEDSHSVHRKGEILKLAHYYITDFEQVLNGTYQTLK